MGQAPQHLQWIVSAAMVLPVAVMLWRLGSGVWRTILGALVLVGIASIVWILVLKGGLEYYGPLYGTRYSPDPEIGFAGLAWAVPFIVMRTRNLWRANA